MSLTAFTARAITPRQYQTLECIKAFLALHGFSPTRAEIATELGVTRNAVEGHMRHLEAKGYIALTSAVARGIKIIAEAA